MDYKKIFIKNSLLKIVCKSDKNIIIKAELAAKTT